MIDLRSDTVTRPDAGMKEAMVSTSLGDDVYGEDPTVNQLQEYVAGLLGKEQALFVPTGVMSNQLCLKALTQPGNEAIVGESSHIFNYETGAPALLSGIQLHTIPDPRGRMSLEDVDQAIREDAYYLPRTSVIAQEQTHNREGGAVIPLDVLQGVAGFAHERGIAAHLDGARLWNACVATGISPREYAAPFDTVSVCLSKGLGAPVGSVMVGSSRHIEIAHKFRKIWGGGWRQAGILAAAGLYALHNNVDRLAEDHRKAVAFVERLQSTEGVKVFGKPETNIVLFSVPGFDTHEFSSTLASRGVLISAAFKGKLRAVFHLDVSFEQSIEAADLITDTVYSTLSTTP
jgi:threonine aldolase